MPRAGAVARPRPRRPPAAPLRHPPGARRGAGRAAGGGGAGNPVRLTADLSVLLGEAAHELAVLPGEPPCAIVAEAQGVRLVPLRA